MKEKENNTPSDALIEFARVFMELDFDGENFFSTYGQFSDRKGEKRIVSVKEVESRMNALASGGY